MSSSAPSPAVTVEKRDNALIATINAKMLDDKELKVLGNVLDEATKESANPLIVINLEHVQLVPSLALGLLLRIQQKCTARKQEMVLAGLSPQVRQIFTITKLDRLLKLVDTVDAAISQSP